MSTLSRKHNKTCPRQMPYLTANMHQIQFQLGTLALPQMQLTASEHSL